jgi:hypothetical protein
MDEATARILDTIEFLRRVRLDVTVIPILAPRNIFGHLQRCGVKTARDEKPNGITGKKVLQSWGIPEEGWPGCGS